MEENKNSIFRKKSLDRISTPEDLDSYLVVTGPGIWFILITIVVLLAGVFTWAILGRLDTVVNVSVISTEETVMCLIPSENVDSLSESSTVKISDNEYKLKDIGLSEQMVSSQTNADILSAGSLSEGTMVKPFAVDAELPDGIYKGEIILETVKPISFITN